MKTILSLLLIALAAGLLGFFWDGFIAPRTPGPEMIATLETQRPAGDWHRAMPVTEQGFPNNRLTESYEQIYGPGADYTYVAKLGSNHTKLQDLSGVGRIDFLDDNKDTIAHCSGAAISETHVLTAGHCFYEYGDRDRWRTYSEAIFTLDILRPNDEGIKIPLDFPKTRAKAEDKDLQDKWAVWYEGFDEPDLDYAVLPFKTDMTDDPWAEARDLGKQPVKLADAPLTAKDELYIGHHAEGMVQVLSAGAQLCEISGKMREDWVRFEHSCDTQRGSSGAPVFSANYRAVTGLHVCCDRLNTSERSGWNYAVSIAKIAEDNPIVKNLIDKNPLTAEEKEALSEQTTEQANLAKERAKVTELVRTRYNEHVATVDSAISNTDFCDDECQLLRKHDFRKYLIFFEGIFVDETLEKPELLRVRSLLSPSGLYEKIAQDENLTWPHLMWSHAIADFEIPDAHNQIRNDLVYSLSSSWAKPEAVDNSLHWAMVQGDWEYIHNEANDYLNIKCDVVLNLSQNLLNNQIIAGNAIRDLKHNVKTSIQDALKMAFDTQSFPQSFLEDWHTYTTVAVREDCLELAIFYDPLRSEDIEIEFGAGAEGFPPSLQYRPKANQAPDATQVVTISNLNEPTSTQLTWEDFSATLLTHDHDYYTLSSFGESFLTNAKEAEARRVRKLPFSHDGRLIMQDPAEAMSCYTCGIFECLDCLETAISIELSFHLPENSLNSEYITLDVSPAPRSQFDYDSKAALERAPSVIDHVWGDEVEFYPLPDVSCRDGYFLGDKYFLEDQSSCYVADNHPDLMSAYPWQRNTSILKVKLHTRNDETSSFELSGAICDHFEELTPTCFRCDPAEPETELTQSEFGLFCHTNAFSHLITVSSKNEILRISSDSPIVQCLSGTEKLIVCETESEFLFFETENGTQGELGIKKFEPVIRSSKVRGLDQAQTLRSRLNEDLILLTWSETSARAISVTDQSDTYLSSLELICDLEIPNQPCQFDDLSAEDGILLALATPNNTASTLDADSVLNIIDLETGIRVGVTPAGKSTQIVDHSFENGILTFKLSSVEPQQIKFPPGKRLFDLMSYSMSNTGVK